MEHSGKCIILADMGELKSYKVEHVAATGRTHIEPINDIDYIEGRKKIGDTISDDQGNFQHASGENHGLEQHVEQQLVQKIADDISAMLADAAPGSCYLAFPPKHHKELTAALSETARKALAKNIASDLVKCPKEEILNHFA